MSEAKTSRIAWGEPALLVYLALAALLLVAVTGTAADPDLWGHLRFGHDVVATGAVPHSDVYSFTTDRPWVNHEWLAEVVMYGAFAVGGSSGLVALKSALVMAILAVVFWSLRRFRPSSQAYAVVLVVGVVGTLWRIQTLRPQLFSLVLFAVLLLALSEADRGRLRGLIAIPVVMGLWVNLHGGWLVGIGILEAWIALAILDRQQPWRRRWVLCAVGVGSALATLANPYGIRMWTFLWTTVGFARPDILEWAPISSIPLGAAVPWIVSVAAAGIVAARSRQPRRLRALILVTLLAVAAFRVNRLDAFLAVAVVVLLAQEFAQLWPARRSNAPDPHLASHHRYAAMAVTVLVAIAMSLSAGPIVFAQLTCLEPSAISKPESEAANFIEANHLRGNLLNWFDWGEYVIWRFGPSLKVSIDGRRETVYSDRQVAAHYRFYRNESDAQDFASAIDAAFIWLPKRFPIVDTLRRQGWQVAFEGPESIVFAKSTDHRVWLRQVHPSIPAARCFPDS